VQIKILAVVFLAIWLINSAISAAPQPATVHVLTIDGTIEPTVAQYVQLGIQRAEKENASAVLIELRTPGGLVDSTRDIVTEMLNTNVPVIVYVSPNGARAGSAGVFITMAGHVAAMAPVSNIGSAHPVLFGTGGSSPSDSNNQNDVMMEKVTNDAAKYIVAIAEKRGRNKEWAEKAVRESANITASEAVKLNVVDFIAENEREVLRKADGMKVEIPGGEVTLAIKDARLKRYPMPWYKLLLHYLADPEVAFILMLIAIYGIIFEINTPGVTLPGIVGGVAFILFLYSLSVLPVNYAGLILILAGIGMMIADIKVASHGVLSVGGAISFFFGAFMLFGTNSPYLRTSITVLVVGTVATAAFFIFLVGMGAKALRRPVVTGQENIIGRIVTAKTDIAPTGKIFLEGSWWTAQTEDQPINKGELVRVVGLDGLTVKVVKEDEA